MRPVPLRSIRLARLLVVLAIVAIASGPGTSPVVAADAAALTMEARVLLGGNVRPGSWMAIEVHLRNDGPPITGELQLAGGAQGRTRFGTPVDLPTTSDKTYLLYAQPPAFGRDVEVRLVDGSNRLGTVRAGFTIRDGTQLVVGIVAERPQGIVAGLDLLPNQNQVAPAVLQLTPGDLPSRVEAWGPIDRLIWQDVDSNLLEPDQIAALRGWIAGGGRLILAGGSAGPATLSNFPDTILPYRPTGSTDVAPGSLGGLLGELPGTATDVLALSGELTAGRALATVGDRAVAAERAYGNGVVTLIGFDPSTPWIVDSKGAQGLWRNLLPARAAGGLAIVDDNQLVSAVSQLPALALPPIGGLLGLLGAYILLIGPINYLVLRRLDRREWAWVTMPVLIVVFAVGAYGFGAALRGSNLIVNEIAIVRGAPGATDGVAQVYLGLFSPSRGTYQVQVPGGALLSAPISGDWFGGETSGASLDVLQGDPARVRDLAVGFGSLRAIRAETAVEVPLVESDLQLIDGRITGTIRNASDQPLERAAVVLGSTAKVISDLAPGQSASVDIPLEAAFFGQSLSDRIVGTFGFGDPANQNDEVQRQFVRRSIVEQLTYDPMFGSTNQLPSEGPVILAWGTRDILDVEIEGEVPRRTGNVLYYLSTSLTVHGSTTFTRDLVRSTLVETDSAFFSKDPWSISLGRGSATMAFRPIAFEGTFTARRVFLDFGFGDGRVGDTKVVEPLDEIPPPCDPATDNCQPGQNFDGMPEIEVFDLTGDGAWRRLPKLQSGFRYELADPARYVEPTSGTVLVRFVNDISDGSSFNLGVELQGDAG